MGVYDFNTTAYDINEIIRQLKHELQSIVVNSQSSITEIKQKISADEALLDRLKKEVDELPDFTEQYNELRVELDKLKVVLDEISKHPIILDNIDVSGSGKLYTEVQKINHQLIYANHAVHDASGRNIIDTYATKDEIAGIDSSLSNKKDRQAELTFDGSAVKTVKKITQNANGELDVEFVDIAGGGGGSQIEIESPDNSIAVSNETVGSAEKYELSVNTDVVATKESVDEVKAGLNNLTGAVDNHAAQIGQIQEDINGIDSSLSNKKDRQPELTFGGSSIKTVKKIAQNVNGELDVEFEDIDYPDYSISSPDGSINVSTSEGVTDLTLPGDVVRDSSYVHVEGATEVPLTDGIASAGISVKYAREDHVHPSDTSREDIANKTTVVLGTSDSKYPTDKAVAEFVNSSIATNTANYISNNDGPFTSVEQLNAYTGAVTNNDYAFVTGIDPEGNTYYDRYKAVVNGSSVTWALEYRLNNSSFTAAQWSAINSGITSALVAKIHDHSNKDVLDGITSSDVADWNSKQNSLTAGDNITIDGNTISSDQVFVAIAWTTKYAEVKAAHAAGKICTVIGSTRYYFLSEITDELIRFVSPSPNPNIFSLTLTRDNIWSSYNPWLQTHLTFDNEPKAGSKNPVTSDGIKTAISNSVDQTYSSTSTKAQSGVAVNEAFKTRETSGNDDSYTYLGMNKNYGGPEALYWKLVSFNTVNNYWTLQFEVDVSNGRKSIGSYDTEIYETKRLTICGKTPGYVAYASELRYAAQGIDSNRGYDNNIYYEISSSNLVTVYIKAINQANKTQICRLKDVINFRGISNITWHEPVSDAGTQPTNPVKFKEFFPAIASTTSNIGSDSVPVYVNNGKPVACNSSNLKAGKDDDGNVIKNTYQKKLTFDATPTAGSTNPVTSDGIKKAIGAVNDAVVDLSQSVGVVKDDLNNLAATAGSNATQIGQLQTDVESIETSLANKKDRQSELNFAGSATKTVKSITQDANGVINVEYENIDFVRGDSNVEIKSEDNSVNVVESTDSQTNTKTYDLSVADSIKSKIKDITITNDTLVIIGD